MLNYYPLDKEPGCETQFGVENKEDKRKLGGRRFFFIDKIVISKITMKKQKFLNHLKTSLFIT